MPVNHATSQATLAQAAGDGQPKSRKGRKGKRGGRKSGRY